MFSLLYHRHEVAEKDRAADARDEDDACVASQPHLRQGQRIQALIRQICGPHARRSGPTIASAAPSASAPQSRTRGVEPETASQTIAGTMPLLAERSALGIQELLRCDQNKINQPLDAATTERGQFQDTETRVAEVKLIDAECPRRILKASVVVQSLSD